MGAATKYYVKLPKLVFVWEEVSAVTASEVWEEYPTAAEVLHWSEYEELSDE